MTRWSSSSSPPRRYKIKLELHFVIVDVGSGQVKVLLNLLVETRLVAIQKILMVAICAAIRKQL